LQVDQSRQSEEDKEDHADQYQYQEGILKAYETGSRLHSSMAVLNPSM
jgi:hypothetical protein